MLKWSRFLLLLFLIPNLIYAFDDKKCEKKTDEIQAEWKRHNELIQEANKLASTEEGEIANLLREAIACCQRANNICNDILEKIAAKKKKERNESYWIEVKNNRERDRTVLSKKINELQKSLNVILSQIAIRKARALYIEAEKKVNLAQSKEHAGPPRRLDNVEAVIPMLNECVKLYEEAVAFIREALAVVSPYFNLITTQNELKKHLERYQEAANKYKNEAADWPEIIALQKSAINQHLSLLKEESQLLEEKGFKHSSIEIKKHILATLEYLVDWGDKESFNELTQLKDNLSHSEEKPHITISTIPIEDREREQKGIRDLFFKNKWALNPSIFFQSFLQNTSRPLAIPLDGQTGEKRGEFTLYKGQFYRFVVQSDVPISYLLIKVYEKGNIVHEEKVPLPLKNTPSWQRYLTTDGMVFVPETRLKSEFGLDLYLTVIPDPTCQFSFLVSQKSLHSNYQFSASLDDSPPLYKCRIETTPPWQLGMLKKPALPSHDKPIPKSSPSVASFTKEEKGNPHPLEKTQYPVLNQLVEELKRDPLLLAQYVHHEISFVDPYLQQNNGVFQAPNIQRSAYTTYLEKQGSPWEQCQLLVYLLRKAGYKAEYAIGDFCSLSKTFAERLFLTQIPEGQKEVLARYPWVVFYDGKEWISLFPWMKEFQIHEGYDLYGLLPEEYASADRWILRYLKGDKKIAENIGSDGDDTAGTLFVRFVETELQNKGLTLADIGIQRTQIKRQFASWEDFPRPSLKGEPKILPCLSANLFNYVKIVAYQHEGGQEIFQHSFDLASLETNAASIWFSSLAEGNLCFHFGVVGREGPIYSYALDENHHNIDLKVIFTPIMGSAYLHYEHTITFAVGTQAALCFTSGGTSSKMTSLAYENFSQEKNEEKRLHALLSFVGTAYFERCNRSERILANLHKIAPRSILGFGLSKLSPSPSMSNPDVKLPQVDMMWFAFNPNQKFAPISWHQELLNTGRQFHTLKNVDFSSNEHQILREIFDDKGAISTVKLLQLAHLEHQKKGLSDSGFLVLSKPSFEAAEKMPEAAQGIYFPHLKELKLRNVPESSSGQWSILKELLDFRTEFNDWTYGYMTPGLISSEKGTYQEMGTLIFNPYRHWALISNNNLILNGGLGSPFYFTPTSIHQWQLIPGISSYNTDIYKLQTSSSFALQSNSVISNSSELINSKPASIANPQSSPGTKKWISDIREWGKDTISTVGDPVDVVTGAFYINELDLLLPGPFPLEIRRNYNSQNPLIGDFGIGWKISLSPYLIKQDDKLYAAEVDGTVIAYSYNHETSRWEVFPENNPQLSNFNRKWTGSNENPFHAYIENDTLYGTDGSKRVFEDGLLRKWINNQGHALTFSYDGDKLSRIESSHGDYCGLHYNHEGKVSEIYSRDGRRIYYNYNPQGDLIRVSLPNTAVISYEYDEEHRIIQETKPHGKILKNRYKDGKVQKQLSPMGPEQEMVVTADFDYQDNQTIVTDAKGGQTTYKIFQKQIYKVTDPLGYQTLQSWFIDDASWFDPKSESIVAWKQPGGAAKSLKASTDKRGLTTYYLYDRRGNPVEIGLKGSDLTGSGETSIVKKLVFNDLNLCIQEEMLDQKTKTSYDKAFPYLPKRIEKYSGNVLLSYVDLDYNSQGLVEKEETSGSITLWKYDNRGFPYQKTQVTGTDDPDVITTYSYNHQGQCIQVVSADGIQESDYDIMGNLIQALSISLSGKLLSATYIGYNLNNEPIWKQTANSQNTLYIDYHASGAIKASRQAVSPTQAVAYTLYEYDSRGYLTQEVDPMGYTIYRDYDAIGNVKCETKEGHSTFFTYEPGSLPMTIISPSGAKTTRLYTTNGLLKEEIYPDGTKSTVIYDYFGRPVLETKKNISWKIKYDDLHHQVIRTNIATKISEIREFDARGNLIRFTDPAGYSSEKTYDGLNRLKTETSPNGQKTIWNYQGDTLICNLPNGEKRIDRYEGGHVVESKVINVGDVIIESSSYQYDPGMDIEEFIQGEEVTISWMNALGLPVKIQKGNIITSYEYDLRGNCVAVTDGDGRITRQTFDGLGQMIQKELPDGSLIKYVYDLDSNLVEYHLPSGAVWKASYDLMRRKTVEELQAGRQSSLHWEYTYENGYLKEAKDPMQRVHVYQYEQSGRLSQEITSGGRRTYTYDPRGLIVAAEQTRDNTFSWLSSWVYGSNAEHSLVERSYDSDGNLSSELIYLNSNLIQETKQTWEASSRSLQIDGQSRDFIYQNNRLIQVSTNGFDLSYTYDLSGSLKSKSTPWNTTAISYNPSGLPENIQTKLFDRSIQESLEWYPSGKLSFYSSPMQQKKFVYTNRGNLQAAGAEKYDFDFGISGTGICTAAPGWVIPQNGIDAFGKVLTEIIDKNPCMTTYNPIGEVIGHNQRQMDWDAWGRLIKVSDGEFTWEASYDAFGRRLQTRYTSGSGAVLTTTSFYDPEKEFQEIGIKYGNKTFWKIYGPNSCDAVIDERGTSAVLIHNALGQLAGIVSEQGTILNEQLPSSYGAKSSAASIPTDVFSYAQSLNWHSQAQDPMGLIWMGARYYEPKSGRFLSPDPIGYPICLDLYAYAGGDPVNYLDPDGRFFSPFYQPIKAKVLNAWHSPQVHGAIQLGFGISQVTAGAAYTGATGGIGGVAGGGLILFRGFDDIYTGFRQIISNNWVDSGKSQLLQACGASRGFAEGADTVVGFFSPKGMARTLSLAKKVEEVALHTKSNLRMGQQVHKSYKAGEVALDLKAKEYYLPSKKRIDFLDIENGKVYELKPNNPRAIREGQKQLKMYIEELKTIPKFKHIEWEGILETY